MRALLLLALAACTESGVSSNPQDWDVAVGRFANAWCDWNATCGTKHDATCVDEVTSIMNEQTRPELATNSEDACVSCMGAWTDVLDADLSPCAASLTSDQQQAVTAACVVNCIENHDLPGTSPQ